jgi:hypothetical protein
MQYVECKTQADLDRALAQPDVIPILIGKGTFSIRTNATVEARGSSSPSGSVGKFAALVASKHDKAKLKISGALILETPEIKTGADWCDYYGVTVKRGIATLYKAVGGNFESSYRTEFLYTPGTKPSAPDWDGGQAECGGGLHFSPSPGLALQFSDGPRFVACPVKVNEIVVHKNAMYPNKIKAPRVYGAIYEVDVNGEPVAEEAKAA